MNQNSASSTRLNFGSMSASPISVARETVFKIQPENPVSAAGSESTDIPHSQRKVRRIVRACSYRRLISALCVCAQENLRRALRNGEWSCRFWVAIEPREGGRIISKVLFEGFDPRAISRMV
jgi:hypothetical protein